MCEKLICKYCDKWVNKEEAVRNGRYDEPHYSGEPVWHPECLEKEYEYARDKGTI